jgi:hypothetical protein
MITVMKFLTARVVLVDVPETGLEPYMLHMFNDGTNNVLQLAGMDTRRYVNIARWAGYALDRFDADWRAYAVHHDLTHHFLADWMRWPHSWSLHDNIPEADWPAHVHWEEHLVNALQRHARCGEGDELGHLDHLLGDRLHEVSGHLVRRWEEADAFLCELAGATQLRR